MRRRLSYDGGESKLARTLTAEHEARLGDDVFDVDRGFFRLCSDVAARSYYDKRVCLAVQVFDIESPEKDRGSGDDALTQSQAFTQHRNNWECQLKWGEVYRLWNVLRFAK
jgi:hypothetical protein